MSQQPKNSLAHSGGSANVHSPCGAHSVSINHTHQASLNEPQYFSTRVVEEEIAQDPDVTNILVTVLMPCLNEARTLAACIQKAHAGCQEAIAQRTSSPRPVSGSKGEEYPSRTNCDLDLLEAPTLSYEILIADNGSIDGSPGIAIANGARMIHVEQKGYGAALLGGIAVARGKYIAIGDSDCSYDFGEVPRFLDKLEEGYDLVMGNRFSGGIISGAMPWHHRYIGNPLLSGLGRLLYRTHCRDWHCGLRAFDRKTINKLKLECPGMEFASEMLVKSALNLLREAEIPVFLHPDGRNGPPHIRSLRDGVRHLQLLLRYYFWRK